MIEYNKILNKKLIEVFKEVIKNIEKNGLFGKNHLYITFQTSNKKNDIPVWLLKKHPEEMTIVIQHEYYYIKVKKNDFRIGLSFNNAKCDLLISFDSIISFADPSANFGLSYHFNKLKKTPDKLSNNKEKKVRKNKTSNVINLKNYKKELF